HQATINLAFDGTDFDNDITNFNITVLATELSGDENLTSNNLTIDAVNEEGPIATLSSVSELRENSLDGAVVKVTLTNEVFASDCAVCDNFELCNIPEGVGLLEVERNSDTEVEITLSFDGTDFDEDSINFCVRVKANAIGGSVDLLSSKATIYADMESNIVNIDNNQNLKIYPNPVNDHVTLEFKSASERKISLQLIDLTGKKIMEKEFCGGALYLEKTLNLSDLKKGNYYLVVHQGEKRTITSVVKQ
ncbi:MAG: T9SS type A sorting domain-containing protein, partial [Bacteroidales bacterium]|nr:T9SS type A sorting domain-containing protein [Bacteroidales bacterium]